MCMHFFFFFFVIILSPHELIVWKGYVSMVLSHNTDEIKDHVVQFYQRLSSERSTWRPRMDNQVFSSIDEEEKNWLERDFEEEEV
jgi:hypothetical protein